MSKILISRLRKYSNVSIEIGAAATKKLLHFCNPRAAFTFYNWKKITFEIFGNKILLHYAPETLKCEVKVHKQEFICNI